MKVLMFCCLWLVSLVCQAIEPGSPAPACELKKLTDGSEVSVNQPGKVVYVDFWASWCGPCAQSMPFMNETSEQLKSKNFEVIAINLDEDVQAAREFLEKYPVKFTIATNPDGQCPQLFDVQAMPSSYLIDRSGKIRHIQLGFHEAEKALIREKIEKLLAE